MSRVREEHVHGSDTVTAVKDGIAGVGRVIVAAALIMSSVFFSFLLSPDRVSKEFGLLLGISILCDAFLMRLTFVPALLTLLGERSWWIPAWLAKILPNITIEAPGTREPHPDHPPSAPPPPKPKLPKNPPPPPRVARARAIAARGGLELNPGQDQCCPPEV